MLEIKCESKHMRMKCEEKRSFNGFPLNSNKKFTNTLISLYTSSAGLLQSKSVKFFLRLKPLTPLVGNPFCC